MLIGEWVLRVTPVGHIKSQLQVFGHTKLNFVPEIDRIESPYLVRAGFPGYPRLELECFGSRRRCLIDIGETPRSALDSLGHKQADREDQSGARPSEDAYFHPPTLTAPFRLCC